MKYPVWWAWFLFILNLNVTSYSRQENPVQTWEKNPVHQTWFFKLENSKNQVKIDRKFGCHLSMEGSNNQPQTFLINIPTGKVFLFRFLAYDGHYTGGKEVQIAYRLFLFNSARKYKEWNRSKYLLTNVQKYWWNTIWTSRDKCTVVWNALKF